MKNYVLFLTLFLISVATIAQENEQNNSPVQDSTKVEILDEVLVKSVRVDADSPITHSNVSKEDLESRNLGQDIPILLNFLPSVVTTSDAGTGIGYTGIRVRGVSGQSTNVTINGIPYNDAESLGTFWVNLPDFASSVESLQLQRGVGSSTNGSGAFGASINILTEGFSKTPSAEVSTAFGSFNTQKYTVEANTGALNDHFAVSARLSQIKSDGFTDRASSDLKSYFLQGSYFDDNTLIKAVVFGGKEVTYQSWYGNDEMTNSFLGLPESVTDERTFNIAGIQFDDAGNFEGYYDTQVDNYNQDHYQLHWNEKLNNNWSTNLGLNYTYGRGYYEEYVDDYLYQNIYFSNESTFDFLGLDPIVVDGQTIESMDYIRRKWLDNDFYVINANAIYKNDKINLNFGGTFSLYEGDHFGEIVWSRYAPTLESRDRYYEGSARKADASFFTKATYKINDKLSFYGDLQYRDINYDTQGLSSDVVEFAIDKNFGFFNPKVGVSYNLNDKNNFYASFARANREPSRSDFEANEDVKPEQLNDFELGWRYSSPKLIFNANAYYMAYNEQLVLTGALDNVGAPIRANSGESYRLGIELESAVEITKKFNIQANIALSSNKNKNQFASIDGEFRSLGDTNIAYSPEIVAGSALNFLPIPNLKLTWLSKYVGEQYMGNVDSEFSKLDAYFVNDFNLSYTITPKKVFKSIVINGLVNNILNKEYASNGYYYSFDDDFSVPGTVTTIEGKGIYPQATSNFLLGATFKF